MYKRPYMESSVFIAFIKGEMIDDHDCKAVVDSILAGAEDGTFPICTSSLTIAEVFKTKKSTPLTEKENEDLRPYFRAEYIRLIEVDRDIAEHANELCRIAASKPGAHKLRPNDAIHIACAERAGCDVLLSYDTDLTKQVHDSFSIQWPERIGPLLNFGPLELTEGEVATQGLLRLGSGSSTEMAEDDLTAFPTQAEGETKEADSAEPAIEPSEEAKLAVPIPVPSANNGAGTVQEEGSSGFKAPDPPVRSESLPDKTSDSGPSLAENL